MEVAALVRGCKTIMPLGGIMGSFTYNYVYVCVAFRAEVAVVAIRLVMAAEGPEVTRSVATVEDLSG
jgi:hypothetical protein